MSEHKQMTIFNPVLNETIEVDEGIAPLLEAIWNLGISTCNSCQENKPGVIWIEFSSVEDAEIFLTYIASGLHTVNSLAAGNWLYYRIMGHTGGWQYNAHLHDSREFIDEESGTLELNVSEPRKIAVSISIRFPIKDYGKLLDLVGR